MLPKKDMIVLAKARLDDAEILYKGGRHDGAVYLCGYSVEIALKARICETLNWDGYPSTRGEFQKYQSFRTHDFDTLIRLSGYENRVKKNLLADWSNTAKWEPGIRYQPIGSAGEEDARIMIQSTLKLIAYLLKGML